jgi:mRNA interferase MazF
MMSRSGARRSRVSTVRRACLEERHDLLWIVMITSAANHGWPGDVSIAKGFRSGGLLVPSVVRPAKIATIESRDADRIGTLPDELWSRVEVALRRTLGFD